MIRIEKEQVEGSLFKLAAYCDGYPVGYLMYDLFVFDSHTAIITDLEVDSEFRKRGIATELVETAIEQIFHNHIIRRIWLQDGSGDGITSLIVTKLGFEKSKIGGNLAWELRRTHSSVG